MFLGGALAYTLSLPGQSTTEDLIASFFTTYAESTDQALDDLFATNPWMSGNSSGTENVKLRIRESAKLMGGFVGTEKLAEQVLGASLKTVIYMVKYERQPLRFTFQFYKPREEWMIYNFSFDEELGEEMEDAIKQDYLSGKAGG